MQVSNALQQPFVRFVLPEIKQVTKVIKLEHYRNVHLPKYRELKLYIKYMVSLRCKMIVKSELERLGLDYDNIDLGVVELSDEITLDQRNRFRDSLMKSGLELMEDRKSVLIEKVKALIIEMIHYADELTEINYSVYISKKMLLDYNYIASMFSEVKGITIQQFIILHKIEKVKELLLYDEMNLTDIAYKLHYSSVAHLSNQFKKITGLSPSYFKQLKVKRSETLSRV